MRGQQKSEKVKVTGQELQSGVVIDAETAKARAEIAKAESFEHADKEAKTWRGLRHPVTAQYLLPRGVSYYDAK